MILSQARPKFGRKNPKLKDKKFEKIKSMQISMKYTITYEKSNVSITTIVKRFKYSNENLKSETFRPNQAKITL